MLDNPPRRSWPRPLLATAAVLSIGGSLLWWQASAADLEAAERVATVNGVVIRRTDYQEELRNRFPAANGRYTAAQKREVLDGLIDEELWVQHGLSLHLPDRDEEVRDALVDATRGHVSADALGRSIEERDIKDWHDRHLSHYATEGEIAAEDYVLPGSAAADGERILAALRAGTAPASLGLVRTQRTDGAREFYFAARIHLGDELFAAASGIGKSGFAGPVRLNDGTHFVRVTYNDPPRALPFAEVKAQVLNDIQHDRRDRVLRQTGKDLRGKARIETSKAL